MLGAERNDDRGKWKEENDDDDDDLSSLDHNPGALRELKLFFFFLGNLAVVPCSFDSSEGKYVQSFTQMRRGVAFFFPHVFT